MSKYVWENIMKNKGFVIDGNNIALLDSIFKEIEIKKNEFFLKQGDKSTEVAFVQKGVFRSFYIDTKGNDITKYFYAEDSVLFSYVAYFTNKESAYYIQAVEDSYKSTVIEPGPIETNFFSTLSKTSDKLMNNSNSPYYDIYIKDIDYRKIQKRTDCKKAASHICNIVSNDKLKARYKVAVPFSFKFLIRLPDSIKEFILLRH